MNWRSSFAGSTDNTRTSDAKNGRGEQLARQKLGGRLATSAIFPTVKLWLRIQVSSNYCPLFDRRLRSESDVAGWPNL